MTEPGSTFNRQPERRLRNRQAGDDEPCSDAGGGRAMPPPVVRPSLRYDPKQRAGGRRQCELIIAKTLSCSPLASAFRSIFTRSTRISGAPPLLASNAMLSLM